MINFDAVLIGDVAAGRMCANEAGKISLTVPLIDPTYELGVKIRISSGE